MIQTVKLYEEEETHEMWNVVGLEVIGAKKYATAEPDFADYDIFNEAYYDILGFTIRMDDGSCFYLDVDFLELKNGTKCVLPVNSRISAWSFTLGKFFFIEVNEKTKTVFFFA